MNTIFHSTDPQLLAYLSLSVGIILRYIISRRKFNRRGIGGLQQFDNFENAVGITLFEWLLKWIANAMMLVGIIIILTS